ncbi:hypothetical protein HELRODRAFT_190600 [Helobdella robusta]|uniref:Ribosome biogenesis protein BRX1 homolog n=1 Tax=Helobdella robusta TaxID=6412 RepID=T1FS44_HELRO|nr:hypothetical protein HELRODRAFT_190600 [Helobdella robusta]ESO08778.1 hypothetical protein HELRODRAFT_190600 [Helobdella robusta]
MGKRKLDPTPTDEPENKKIAKKSKWTNKTRVLVFSSRGVSFTQRHLMMDLRSMMPHSKKESKREKKDSLFAINEICEMRNCNKCLYFENRKKSSLYMWMSCVPAGPSAKFLVENIHTMLGLKLTGNCLKGSRPLLSFDKTFETAPHWKLLKEMFTQILSVPYHHPKSKPFVDHVLTFTIANNLIHCRNYQIAEENAELVEIGPRMSLNLIKIFSGSFSGEILYNNPKFTSPNTIRNMLKLQQGTKYLGKLASRQAREVRRPDYSLLRNPIDDVFGVWLQMF